VAAGIATPCSSLTVTLPVTRMGVLPLAVREILVERKQPLVQPTVVGVALGPGFGVRLGRGVAVAVGLSVAVALAFELGVALGSGSAVELGVGVGSEPPLPAAIAYT